MTVRQIPQSMQKTYDKAMTGKGRRPAVKAMCKECTGYDRKEVSKAAAQRRRPSDKWTHAIADASPIAVDGRRTMV